MSNGTSPKRDDHLLSAGISRKMVDNTEIINHAAWHRAHESGDIIGSCRALDTTKNWCDGYLVVHSAEMVHQITWYEAACTRCHAVVVSPMGKTLPRASNHGDMPGGAWERRIAEITRLFGKQSL